MKKIKLVCALMIFVIILELYGCSGNYNDEIARKALEYTVLKETEIPEEFLAQIQEKKTEEFKLTYRDNEYLYIARGYGEKSTGGYSICVTNLTSEKEAIYFETNLVRPQQNENVNEVSSFPYVVVKTELIEFPVVFN